MAYVASKNKVEPSDSCVVLQTAGVLAVVVHKGQLLTHPEGHKNAEGVWINELHLHISAAYNPHKHKLKTLIDSLLLL